MKYKNIIGMMILVGIFFTCGREKQKGLTEEAYEDTKRALIGANRILVRKDRERIRSFCERRKWDAQETETGLWYEVYENGTGRNAETGMEISLEYELSLLDGTVCYSSDSLGLKSFRIGQGGVESGLEEGVLFLREGDRARFILPPHLAHGLTGDRNAIPPRSILVYDVKVIRLDTLVRKTYP
ncbi:MAG: FKBP-type peptidyl-prolyl cis-trans isomerase [Bacteroidales bacterium]|nr:FKBP-type peptidyl-prolyl cis-trans isomerase [Bacteroidales bacterium]